MSPPKKDPGAKRTKEFRSLEVKLAVVKAYVEGKGNAEEVSKVYGVAPTSVYDWVRIYQEKGEAGFERKSRKRVAPTPIPAQKQIAQEIVETKKAFGWFGVPRITQWLRRAKLLPVTEHQVSKALKEADLVPPSRGNGSAPKSSAASSDRNLISSGRSTSRCGPWPRARRCI